MYKKISALFFFFMAIPALFAQKGGYWDKERSTTKEVVVSARDRILIQIDDLPTGTTELIYRITLLDKNQQIANSLVSVLKAIPDPTGISQGSAGAVFLVSKISGDDKCKYAIFSRSDVANNYVTTGATSEACLIQDEPVSKDAKRLSVDKSTCLKSNINSTMLWFGFESKNWIMNQKIVLEVVPWVDYKLSRGWTKENRKAIIDQCKTSNLAQKMTNPGDFCVCVSDKIQAKYTFKEFQKLLAEERNKAFKDFGALCFNETGASKAFNSDLRTQAAVLAKKGNYGAAIAKMNTVINNGKAAVLDYNTLGYYYLITKQYGKALKTLQEGQKIDATELLIQLNLAHAYLLNGNYKAAKAIHKTYSNQNVTDSLSWTQKTKLDFDAFQKAGIQNDDFNAILKILE
ncbi:tetratricopeptide repeat protein [Flavobacterium sp.]|uniref:tetratricopeptide repeat protein n=1 Tax=Flavobacterium sp. TaxID=239 RepID=UPI0025E8A977|nr:tetratricopeptide repeat protein [Flavobacterium sp.]